MMRFVLFLTSAFILVGVTDCAASRKAPDDGSNTNWLICDTSQDCRGDRSCICGLCTQTCETDQACAQDGQPVSCVDPHSASTSDGCAAVVKNAGVKICLPDCTSDQQCDEGFNCIKGACWPIAEDIIDLRIDSSLELVSDAAGSDADKPDPVRTDASEVDAAADASDTPRVDSSTPVQIEDGGITFYEPIILPEPETRITGDFDPSSLVGVWLSQYDDPEPGSIVRLVIQEAPDGVGFIGSITDACFKESCDYIEEPPPKAVDPNTSYPPSIETDDLLSLQTNFYTGFSYSIFDGRVEGGRISFWISMNELWRDWCALQTSYRVQMDERVEYFCLEEPVSIDRDDIPPITDFNAKELLCSANGSVCKCNKDGCTAYYRDAIRSFDMLIDGGVMQGISFITESRHEEILLYRQ